MERRFQPVLIEEPSEEDALAILRGLKEKYEVHHGIRISDRALVAAVKLSCRYIANRQLPDKAIDLIDEAASALKMQVEYQPAELDELKRQIARLEVARQALLKEKDERSKTRLQETEKELAQTKEKATAIEAKYGREKEVLGDIRAKNKKAEQLTEAVRRKP